jgi:hypothetical protein
MIPVLIVSLVFVLLAFFMFSLRVLFVKEGEFRGTCSSNNGLYEKEGLACSCGKDPNEPCENRNKKHHHHHEY